MEIKKTFDYSLFKKLDGNRNVRKTNALVKSIKELDLTMYSPIIVSEDFRIVDGQHRFSACKELKKPIYFVVMPSEKAEQAMIVLNKCQSQWRNEEFLHYKVAKVGGCYAELDEFMKTYKMGLSYASLIFADKEFDSRRIRENDFTFQKGKDADEIAQFWSCEEFRKLPFRASRAFTRAIRIFFEESNPKQRAKLRRKSLGIEQFANHKQYLTAFWHLVKMRR